MSVARAAQTISYPHHQHHRAFKNKIIGVRGLAETIQNTLADIQLNRGLKRYFLRLSVAAGRQNKYHGLYQPGSQHPLKIRLDRSAYAARFGKLPKLIGGGMMISYDRLKRGYGRFHSDAIP